MSKKPSRKRLHSTTAPHRRQLPREKVSTTNTTTTHPHGKYRYPRIHSHIFLYDPRILVGIFAYLNSLLLLDSCRPVKSTLAPILFFHFTATRARIHYYWPFCFSPGISTHHTTPHHYKPARSFTEEKQEKEISPTSEPLRAACVLCWSSGVLLSLVSSVSGHTYPHVSLSHREKDTRLDSTRLDSRRLKRFSIPTSGKDPT